MDVDQLGDEGYGLQEHREGHEHLKGEEELSLFAGMEQRRHSKGYSDQEPPLQVKMLGASVGNILKFEAAVDEADLHH